MAQAGIHAMVGIVARKWMPKKELLLLGMVLGNVLPDLDNLIVAFATLALGQSATEAGEIYHRTFSHSVFFVGAVMMLFYLIAAVTKNEKWKNFGIGMGVGILMHMFLDLVIWFNGVPLFWPLGGELNFWAGFVKPEWLGILLDTGEFLMFGLYFLMLVSFSQRLGTDTERQNSTRIWGYAEFILFLIFTALFFAIGTEGLIYTIFGALYLVSLIALFIITTKMKKTVESL